MGSNAATVPGGSGPVMASIDSDGDGERFIIADVSRDQAWLAAPAAEALTLSHWQ